MSKKEQKKNQESPAEVVVETPAEEAVPPEAEAPNPHLAALEAMKIALADKEAQYLRLAAEYDNFRKRSLKEKESIYGDAKSDAITTLLPVYDNLERALKQVTCDEAYSKGVEMTMSGLRESLAKLGVSEIPSLGATFDPVLHNAVMHVEQEDAGENTIVGVFQTGFKLGDKVIRFAMVQVAN